MGKPIKELKETIQSLTYEKQALEFLNATETKFKAEFLKYDKHFVDEKDKRDIYLITLTRGEREYKFENGRFF